MVGKRPHIDIYAAKNCDNEVGSTQKLLHRPDLLLQMVALAFCYVSGDSSIRSDSC